MLQKFRYATSIRLKCKKMTVPSFVMKKLSLVFSFRPWQVAASIVDSICLCRVQFFLNLRYVQSSFILHLTWLIYSEKRNRGERDDGTGEGGCVAVMMEGENPHNSPVTTPRTSPEAILLRTGFLFSPCSEAQQRLSGYTTGQVKKPCEVWVPPWLGLCLFRHHQLND